MSEAPLFKRLPSEYIREMYFTTQPLEQFDDVEHTRALFEEIRGATQLLYSSDYPHQDFDLPTQVYDLPFLSDQARHTILGGNTLQLFGLPAPVRD